MVARLLAPNRISVETQDRQFGFWLPCFEGHWNRRLPSLAGSRLPLLERFHRRLVEVRVTGGCEDPNIRNVSLRIKS
jgi:hypothetical protein